MNIKQYSTSLEINPTTISIPKLRAAFKGRLIAPGDPEYDEARTVFFGGIDRRPAAIIQVANVADVVRVVSLARETGLDLAIRSGGHSYAGYSVTEGGIVLDLSSMKQLQINVQHRTAWAETGLTAGEYTSVLHAYGLVTGFGDVSGVGIGGITLGGGIGYLVRKHGLTLDNLLAAEIVTADGQLRRIDAETEPDLFWAIRGGGGNFGVATRFQFRLHEIDTILGGTLVLPATPNVIASFVDAAEAAPDELSIITHIMPASLLPFLPAEARGNLVLEATLVYAGEAKHGEQILAPFRALATPLADRVRLRPYPEMIAEIPKDVHPLGAGQTMFLDAIDRRVAEVILDHLRAAAGPFPVAVLRVLGGAMSRVSTNATAFAHRKSRIMVGVGVDYEQPNEKEAHETWAADFAAALRQSDSGAYVNFLGDEGEARVRAAYPGATWGRLRSIKTRYDPTNLFRLNQNIPPK